MKKVESSPELASPVKTLQLAVLGVQSNHTIETISSIISFLPSRNAPSIFPVSAKASNLSVSPAAERSARDDPPTFIYSPSTTRFQVTRRTRMNNLFKLELREFHRRPENVAIFMNRAAEVDVIKCERCSESRVRGARWKEFDSGESEILSRRCRGGEKG